MQTEQICVVVTRGGGNTRNMQAFCFLAGFASFESDNDDTSRADYGISLSLSDLCLCVVLVSYTLCKHYKGNNFEILNACTTVFVVTVAQTCKIRNQLPMDVRMSLKAKRSEGRFPVVVPDDCIDPRVLWVTAILS